ncbi:mitochondrial substrate carrier family protein N-like [Zophobas morio]|jgi:solute carrier family 25 phosphate transporter 3|uniref:mitochondrial substrate carrier family protein N-like n=1 Tax=Zophobas morio TaxID=2755281 RepID=UPI003082DE8C
MPEQKKYTTLYFAKGALSGGICCSITHGALCPVDVIKTRIQLHPGIYDGLYDGFKKIIKTNGIKDLATGLGPTAFGYFMQGCFKFGGIEFFKVKMAQSLGVDKAWEYRVPIYLSASACAEFIADIFLCPMETARIRQVSNPEYASGVANAFIKILREEGLIRGFYSGFYPLLLKQIPYTMAKFTVQGLAAEQIVLAIGTKPSDMTEGGKMALALSSGVLAGVAAAIISHPADTLLSLINKDKGAGGEGSINTRLVRIARDIGFKKLCITGLGPRCVMFGALTAAQFAIFDTVMSLTGAEKFNFVEPQTLKKV